MNVVTISTCRRPFHTRLCIESLCRAQRWSAVDGSTGWADLIAVCLPSNWYDFREVQAEAQRVMERNRDIPLEFWFEQCESNPHAAAKWMLDNAFRLGADAAVYIEEDEIVSPDAFLVCEWTRRYAAAALSIAPLGPPVSILGCTLYHETIPTNYPADTPPNAALLHLANSFNTCGGTAFLREPFLKILAPRWNCKQVEPKGFDYSAHYLMYVHNLWMVRPDMAHGMHLGFRSSLFPGCERYGQNPEFWQMYFGRSIWAQTRDAVRSLDDFRMERYDQLRPVREPWMRDELARERIE